MSTRVLRKRQDSFEYIEKLLEKTTLSTQRVTHTHIMKLGENALTRARSAGKSEKDSMFENVVMAAEKRHSQELRAALERQSEELEEEHREQIIRIKAYYEKLAKRVTDERDKAEAERLRLLTKEFQQNMQSALEEQRLKMEKEKEEAIKLALAAQLKQLRNEFALEKEKAIAEALAKARESFRVRLQEAIAATKAECERLAAEEAARVAAIHAAEVKRLNDKCDAIQKQYENEKQERIRLEKDFMELQDDYKRFMIYTGGKYNADYLMIVRDYGWDVKGSLLHQLTTQPPQNKTPNTARELTNRAATAAATVRTRLN